MNDTDRDLEELYATLAHYRQLSQQHRFNAEEHLSDARWYETEARRLRQEIAELETQDGD